MTEITLQNYEALLTGLTEVVRQDGTDPITTTCIALMTAAQSPKEREHVLEFLSGYLDLQFPLVIILDLSDETYKGFETITARLNEAGWLNGHFMGLVRYYRWDLLDCKSPGQKANVIKLMKAVRRQHLSLRKALSLAGAPDRYEMFLESAKQLLEAR